MSAVAAATIDSGSEDFSGMHKRRATSGASDSDRPLLLGRERNVMSTSTSLARGALLGRSQTAGSLQLRDSTDLGASGVLRRSVGDYEAEEDLVAAGIYDSGRYSRHRDADDSPMLATLGRGGGGGPTVNDSFGDTGDLSFARAREAPSLYTSANTQQSSSSSKAGSRYSGDRLSRSGEAGLSGSDGEQEDDRPGYAQQQFNNNRRERGDDEHDAQSRPHQQRAGSANAGANNQQRGGAGVDRRNLSVLEQDSEGEEEDEDDSFGRNNRSVVQSSRSAAVSKPPMTPPASTYERDSPGTKSRRTFSNVSKASDASLFRELPNTSRGSGGGGYGRDRGDSVGEFSGGDEDESVNSLALSDSNNFE